jgi:hypothetical protein
VGSKGFNIKAGGELLESIKKALRNKPGIYVLYCDDRPHYIGKADRNLLARLHAHANKSGDRYFNFWNFFSVFVCSKKKYLAELEGILIAAMPTRNSARPKIHEIKIPKDVIVHLRKSRTIHGVQ